MVFSGLFDSEPCPGHAHGFLDIQVHTQEHFKALILQGNSFPSFSFQELGEPEAIAPLCQSFRELQTGSDKHNFLGLRSTPLPPEARTHT